MAAHSARVTSMLSLLAACCASACGLLSAGDFDGLHGAKASGGSSSGGGRDARAGEAGVVASASDAGASDSGAGEGGTGGAGIAGATAGSASGGFPNGGTGDQAPGQAVGGSAIGGAPSQVLGGPAGPEQCDDDSSVAQAVAPLESVTLSSLLSSGFSGWRVVPSNGLPTDPLVTSDPSAAARNPFSVHLFARDSAGVFQQNIGTSAAGGAPWSWRGWQSLGVPPGVPRGMLSGTTWGTRSLAVVARSTFDDNNQAFVRVCTPPAVSGTGLWSAWTQIKIGNLVQDPVIAFSDPYLYVFAPGTDHRLWFSRNDTTSGYNPDYWTQWTVVPNGILSSAASIATRPGGTLFVAALATNSRYYTVTSRDGGLSWSDWRFVDSGQLTFVSAPALVTSPRADGALVLLGTAFDRQLWAAVSTDEAVTWNEFEPTAGSQLTSGPAAVSAAEGSLFMFGRGTDDALWMNNYRQPKQ